MSIVYTDSDNYTAIANAIRAKNGSQTTYKPSEMAAAIRALSGGSATVTVEETTDENGGTVKNIVAVDISDTTATASDVASGKYFYTAAGVKTAGTASGGGGGGTVQTQTKTATPSETQQTIEPDSGYYLSSVTVNAISSSYVGSGITQRSSSDLTVSGDTVTAPSGYYSSSASKAVAAGSAGTPSASKGTVSNHQVSVTPSVTNSAGYISGGTKTGTAVTVSASELVSGSDTVTTNGTVDVTNLASLIVNVSGGGGASNIVTGTFKGTTSGSVLDVNVPYTGSGFPIAGIIYPPEGTSNSEAGTGSFYSLVKRYAIISYTFLKLNMSNTPTYSGSSSQTNNGLALVRYKNSSSDSSSQTTGTQSGANIWLNSDPTGGGTNSVVRMKSKTKLSVFIAANSYGFAPNYDYKYVIIYSS